MSGRAFRVDVGDPPGEGTRLTGFVRSVDPNLGDEDLILLAGGHLHRTCPGIQLAPAQTIASTKSRLHVLFVVEGGLREWAEREFPEWAA